MPLYHDTEYLESDDVWVCPCGWEGYTEESARDHEQHPPVVEPTARDWDDYRFHEGR